MYADEAQNCQSYKTELVPERYLCVCLPIKVRVNILFIITCRQTFEDKGLSRTVN